MRRSIRSHRYHPSWTPSAAYTAKAVRDFAAQQGLDEKAALEKGMETKAVEFVKTGAEVYPEAVRHPTTPIPVPVIPAKAGIENSTNWTPAFAGVTTYPGVSLSDEKCAPSSRHPTLIQT